MKSLFGVAIVTAVVVALAAVGCAQPSAAPTPTKAPAAAPTAAAAPTKPATSQPVPATAVPTKPTASQPTAVAAPAKTTFPEKGRPITFVVGYTAGGGSDIGARLLASVMEKELGVPIQVVNRAGAGSQIAHTDLSIAKPDGYTIGLTIVSSIVTSYLDPRRKATYTRKDFQPMAMHVVEPESITVKGSGPYKTVKDVVEAAKANPEKIKASTTGVGSAPHLALLELQRLTGAKFAAVHFPGNPEALAALLGDHVDVMFTSTGYLMPQIKNGDVRVLGLFDKEESKFLPGVKTLEAQGYGGYGLHTLVARGVSLPAGVPRPIVDIMTAAAKKSMQDPAHVKAMDEQGLALRYMGPEEFAAFWESTENALRPMMDDLIASGG